MNGIRSGIYFSVPGARLQDIVLDNVRIRIGIGVIVPLANISKLPLVRLPIRYHLLHAETRLQARPNHDISGRAFFSWPRSKMLKFVLTESSYLNCW